MERQEDAIQAPRLARRAFLRMCLAVPAPLLLSACVGQGSDPSAPKTDTTPQSTSALPAQGAPAPTQSAPTEAAGVAAKSLPPTPACGDDDVTPPQTAGPFFTPNSPERASLLEPGVTGTKLVVTGHVLTTDCKPVARALLDFWQADDKGEYDNAGYRLRGHQFTDESGRYSLETIIPGAYPGRTRHIHVKVQAPNQPVLTTQLYFSGEALNRSDSIFDPALLMEVQDSGDGDGKAGTFDFVLRIG